MGNRGSETIQTVSAIASACGPLAAQVVNTSVLRQPLSGWTLLALSMPVCLVGFFSCRWALTETLQRSSSVKKILFGKHYIDGTWIEVVSDSSGKAIAAAVMHFDSDASRVRFAGENFNSLFESTGTFHSVGVRNDGSQLEFDSVNCPNAQVGGAVRGLGYYQFDEALNPPLRFTGGFTLLQDGDELPSQQDLSVEGLRVCSDEEVSQLKHAVTRAVVIEKYMRLMNREFRANSVKPKRPIDTSDLK